jgi:Kef-type K+ transport system membrane component KefB
VVLATAHLLGIFFQRIGQPRVIGEMTAGILLGPSLFGRLAPDTFAHLFPADGLGGLDALSQIGLILFLFLVGLELQPHEDTSVGGHALAASSASMITPLVLGALLAIPLHNALARDVPLARFGLFMGAAMSITAFPVMARILTERGLLNSRAGAIAISCAALNDVAAWCLVALLMAASASAWLWVLVRLLVYAAAMLYLIRPLLRGRAPSLVTTLLILLASSWVTQALGVHAFFGAFVAGLVMPRGTPLAKLVEPLTAALLLPLFFAISGLRTSVGLVSGATLWLYCAAIIAVAISGKLFGTAFVLRIRGLPWRESFTVGALVNTRGLIELVILNIGLDRKIISPSIFSMMVLMALVTTFMTTPLLVFVRRHGAQ